MNYPSRRRRLWWRTMALASMLWVGLTPAGSAVPSQPNKSMPVTSAYVFDREGLVFHDRDAAHLNQMNFSFALIENGKATGDHWQSIEDFKDFIARHPHITPVLSVGGWGADGFSQAAATEKGRAKLVGSILDLMQEHGFLGVDIDWEYPGSSAAGIASSKHDRENFTLLMQELRFGLDALTALDGKPRLLACALGASEDIVKAVDSAAIGRLVDQVNLMTYDLQTAHVTSHHTALYPTDQSRYSADFAVRLFAEAGIPKEKMMIGSAHYARIFQLKKETETPLFQPSATDGWKSSAYKKLPLETAQVYFDETAKASYAVDGTAFISYDSPLSIRHKGEYVTQNGLMGMMCWEYGDDPSGELLRAMYESMN